MTNSFIGKYKQIFSFPSFRNFWLGYTLSTIGDGMARVALTWYVWEATHSAKALGLLMLFYLGPIIFGGLIAGWLLDRFEKRKVILIDNLFRGFFMLLVPILSRLELLELWHIYVTAAIFGSLIMISAAGGPAIVPTLVTKDQLSTANALEVIGFTLSGVIGPPIAGLLIASIGAPNILLIDSLSYLLFAFAMTKVFPISEETVIEEKKNDKKSFSPAYKLLMGNKILLSTTIMYFVGNLGYGMMFVWLPIYSDINLLGGSQLYGFLLGAMALGEVISSLSIGGNAKIRPIGKLIPIFQGIAGLSIALMLFGESIVITAVALFLYGIFSAPLTIWAQTLRMMIIPPDLRGRTFALLRMLMISAIPLGGVFVNGLTQIIGMTGLISVSSIAHIIPAISGYQVKELRDSKG